MENEPKVELTPEDLKSIEVNSRGPIAQLLTEMDTWNFNVGDVLVRYRKHHDGRKTICTVSDTNTAPRKYRVVHLDKFGMPYVKTITKNGSTLATTIMSLANQDHANFSFTLDPEYAEYLILDNVGAYDPMRQAKINRQKRQEYKEYNMKLFKQLLDLGAVNLELENWKVGLEFWIQTTDGRGVCYYTKHTVTGIQKFKDYTKMNAKIHKYYTVSSFDAWMLNHEVWHVEASVEDAIRPAVLLSKDLIRKKISYQQPLEIKSDATF